MQTEKKEMELLVKLIKDYRSDSKFELAYLTGVYERGDYGAPGISKEKNGAALKRWIEQLKDLIIRTDIILKEYG